MDWRLQKIWNMYRHKGLKCTYNYLWYQVLFAHQGRLARFLWKTCHPLFVHHPRLVEIEVTTCCPLRCVICEHTYWNEKARHMNFEQFKSIIDQFPKLKWVGLTGIGESFVNPDFMKMLEYVKQKNIYVELYDPFIFIDEEKAREIVRLGIDKIFISLDAATKETYEKVRPGSNFDKVIENIRRFLEIRKQANTPFPDISYHYIINKLNLREVLPYADLVKSLTGTESAIIFTRMLHSFLEAEEYFTEIPDSLTDEVRAKAEETGIRIGWNADAPTKKPPICDCSFWIMPFIFVTGDVIPCCAGNEANKRDFQKKYSLGNVFEQDFKDIWNSDKYKRLRDMIHKGQTPIQCRDCPPFDVAKKKCGKES